MRNAVIIAWVVLGLTSTMTGSFLLGGMAGLLLAFGLFVLIGLAFNAVMR